MKSNLILNFVFIYQKKCTVVVLLLRWCVRFEWKVIDSNTTCTQKEREQKLSEVYYYEGTAVGVKANGTINVNM
jgi:hypothetical protein